MKNRTKTLFVFFILSGLISLTFAGKNIFGQEKIVSQNGCAALVKNKPPLFISYEKIDDKVRLGDEYVKGVMLRVTNNSGCNIAFSAPVGQTPSPANWIIKDNKMIRQENQRYGVIANEQQISLEYFIKYSDKNVSEIGGLAGCVNESVWLDGGKSAFISIPLNIFKKDGELSLPYEYEWDLGEKSKLITKENDKTTGRYETVEHYLRFSPRQLPAEIIK